VNSELKLIAESQINKILRDLAEQTGAVGVQLSDHTRVLTEFDVRIELTMPIEQPRIKRVSALFNRRWSQR
jgi:hypothetical protein